MGEDIRSKIQQGITNNIRTLKESSALFSQNEKMWQVMNGLFDGSKKVLEATDKKELDDLDFAKLLILINCLSDLVAVTHLLQIGFFRPAGMILRGVVENTSLAVAIHQKPEIYEKYERGKYNIPDAVTIAKSFINEIGKVNGLLSNIFTHEPYETIGRGIRMSETATEIMLIPGVDQGQGTTFTVVANIAAMSSLMVAESLEWCLARHLDSFVFWERVGDSHIKTKPNELKSLAMSMAKELETIIGGDNKWKT